MSGTHPLLGVVRLLVVDRLRSDHWALSSSAVILGNRRQIEREIWFAVSRMLWAFEVAGVADKPIDLNEYDGLNGQSPVTCEVSMKPRFEEVGQVLERELVKRAA
ncbi:hypothetical protein DM02DRAFT_665418 [Periconia macrospinosa]|uniref:Uncharacterized protein n=1 Tax=Periconia macrospinosa TaxID=97972 RepID=A0A2V1CWR7_9PLEO|nr:hypothetical protein DM02DRAFT_665418 [Periconia macrospinosa]